MLELHGLHFALVFIFSWAQLMQPPLVKFRTASANSHPPSSVRESNSATTFLVEFVYAKWAKSNFLFFTIYEQKINVLKCSWYQKETEKEKLKEPYR